MPAEKDAQVAVRVLVKADAEVVVKVLVKVAVKVLAKVAVKVLADHHLKENQDVKQEELLLKENQDADVKL